MNKITTEQVEEWLGDYKSFDEAIDVIKEIANKTYSVKSLREDMLEYFDGYRDYVFNIRGNERRNNMERRKDNVSKDDCMITYNDPGDENE